MGTHEATQFGAVMVRTHEQLALVLVTTRIAGRWLSSSCQSLKIKFVRVSFTVYFCHYVFVVVVPKTKETKLNGNIRFRQMEKKLQKEETKYCHFGKG